MTSSRRRWPDSRSSSSDCPGLGGVPCEDRQGGLVVGAEAVPAKLGQDDHALDPVVVGNWHEEHRFGAGGRANQDPARVSLGIGHNHGLVIGGNPTGQPLADAAAEHLCAHCRRTHERTLEGDRFAYAPLVVHAVDPDVVEIDQLARLGNDRLADRRHVVEAAQPTAEVLD